MTDVQARLDAAINAHLAGVLLPRGAILTSNVTRGWIDHYAALVALRARISVLSALFGDTGPYAQGREAGRLLNEATAEAERLLGEDA